MKFTYENQGISTYLVYEISDDPVDTMSLGMLTNNRIAGFAPSIYTQLDDRKYIKYNVSAKITMKQFFMGAVNRKRLLTFLMGIVDALMVAEDYMIETDTILLDADYIFVNVSTGEPEVICIPVLKEHEPPTEYGLFFKSVVFETKFDESENCDYVAAIINYLNNTPMLSLEDFRQMLSQLQSRKVALIPENGYTEPLPPIEPELQKWNMADGQEFIPDGQGVRDSYASKGGSTYMAQPEIHESGINMPIPTGASEKVIGSQMPFEIPGGCGSPVKNNEAEEEKEDRDQISMFYLLQHYNKENAAAYKAQKEAKKTDKSEKTEKRSEKKADKKVQKAVKKSEKRIKKGKPSVSEKIVSGEAFPGGGQIMIPPGGIDLGVHGNQNIPVRLAQSASSAFVQTSTSSMLPYDRLMKDAQKMGANAGNSGVGETVILGNASSGETIILNMGAQKEAVCPYLLRTRNQEKIFLDRPFFRVGRERNYVDYCVGDNAAVGRSHAYFITRGEEYFVLDTNSTNHTFVDGQMIPSNQEIPLRHGTKVCLADEEFEFRTR